MADASTIHKQWIRNDFIRKRVSDIIQKAKPFSEDIRFIHSLCTDGSIDPQKRSFRIHCRIDGALVSFEGCDGTPGVNSCIFISPNNERIVQIFHFLSPFPLQSTKVGSTRSFLEKNVPNWMSMKCVPEGKINDILTKKTAGEEGYFICHAAEGNGERVRQLKDSRPFHLASAINRGIVGETFNEDSSSVTARPCFVNGHRGFSLTLEHKDKTHHLFTSTGLYSVVLDQKNAEGGYVHGMRSLCKSVARKLFSPEPKPLQIENTFEDAQACRRRISSFCMVTNRPIAHETDFGGTCRDFGITYSSTSPPARKSMSAYGSCQSLQALKAFDLQEFQIRGITKLGYSDEEVCDMLLSAYAAARQQTRGQINLLNRAGFTGKIHARCPTSDLVGFRHEFDFHHSGYNIGVYVIPGNVVARLLGGSCTSHDKHCIAFTCEGCISSVHLPEGFRTPLPTEKTEMQKGSELQNAVSRLCYIVAACRSLPQYSKFERSLRAIWLNTELIRFKGNAHDCCILSMVAKNSSNSMHFSVLPYI